ncbi:LysR family transcriptional regulator [Hahella sp. NBU794]|uniref:LysR family transcriptional regulator n=1 Tax=Hahella sp. NBU794 TaxID=3422590 RepID=UPI003D6E1376
MKSDWIESFLVFSECMNFTHAAERLHISQPALHVKIKKLSEQLQTPLYRKSGKELVLTEEGKKVQTFAREIRDRSSTFFEELRHGGSAQPVVLAAGEGAFLYLLGMAIQDFKNISEHPLRLITSDKGATISAVEDGSAHLGVAALSAKPEGLELTLLTEVEQTLAVPRSHRLAKRRQLSLKDLNGEKLILPPPGMPQRMAVEQALMNNGVAWTPSVEARGWELMLHFVKLGVGVSIVNGCCNIPSALTAIPIQDLPKVSYYIIERKGRWKTTGAQDLKSCLLKHKGDWRERRGG